MLFIAYTDTDQNYLGINFWVAEKTDTDTAVLCSPIADKRYYGHNSDLIADADTEKLDFQIIPLWIRTNGSLRFQNTR